MKQLSMAIAAAALAAMSLPGCTGSGDNGGDASATASAPTEELSAALDSGSRWTDGNTFYFDINRHGDTLLLSGGTLHEGGALVKLLATGDSTLQVLGLSEYDMPDYSPFGKVGCTVRHRKVGGSELLVVVDSEGKALDALQRFEGDAMTFVSGYIHELLAGEYRLDENSVYVFTADGKAQAPGMDQAKPYGLDLIYDMPSGSLALANGEHVAVQLVPEGIDVFAGSWDDNEEAWLAGELIGHAKAGDGAKTGILTCFEQRAMIDGLIDMMSVPTATWLLEKTRAAGAATDLQRLNLQLLDSYIAKAAHNDDDQ